MTKREGRPHWKKRKDGDKGQKRKVALPFVKNKNGYKKYTGFHIKSSILIPYILIRYIWQNGKRAPQSVFVFSIPSLFGRYFNPVYSPFEKPLWIWYRFLRYKFGVKFSLSFSLSLFYFSVFYSLIFIKPKIWSIWSLTFIFLPDLFFPLLLLSCCFPLLLQREGTESLIPSNNLSFKHQSFRHCICVCLRIISIYLSIFVLCLCLAFGIGILEAYPQSLTLTLTLTMNIILTLITSPSY